MKDDRKGIHKIIKYLRGNIGLDKDPLHIFADYNHSENATIIASIQHLLNELRGKGQGKLNEDGFYGPDTERALVEAGIELGKSKIDYGNIFSRLKGRTYVLPNHVEIRNWKYFIKHFRAKQFRKMLNVFANDIDVRKYAKTALQAYDFLGRYEVMENAA